MGIDLDLLLHRAREMAWACRSTLPDQDNPALVLGAIIGSLANHPTQPRDKLAIITLPEFAPFYSWVEQLIAESTGKNGRGILPVDGNELPDIQIAPPDHAYIYIRMNDADNRENDEKMAHLAQAGSPIVVLPLVDPYDLGKEFFRWEFATATVGKLLSINPFDQPDVESSKKRARRALAQYKETHSLPSESPVLQEKELCVYGPQRKASSISEYLRAFWAQSKQGDYVALMAYVERNRAHDALLQEMRCMLTEALGLAVTVGFGPRFLHSTGQLHKGGANTGLFLQITQGEASDLPIPDQPHTFGILKQAQAQGDLEALRATERRAMRINIGDQPEVGLGKLIAAIQESTSDRPAASE
jgi:transaldolase/glucose-6-phosphate isomerase